MDKQYLVSFLATIQGDRMVVQGLRGIERTQTKVTKTTTKGAKATQNYTQMMGGLVKRALMVIPVWLLLRTAFMGVIRTIGSMIEGYLDLEDGLARIQTVVHGTAEVVASDMVRIKNEIKDVATKTRIPLKELTETFYFLRTASLTTAEAMSAFEHTVDAMTGTGVKGKEMARAVAGVYNTMGKYILEGASASEKFQRITDVLTYTYATQDVQMDELVQGYTKLAPYISGLTDSFTDLVTMIGFLNTRMLRAGRTGRLTARSILQITKNADKLASIFGITFDPDKPFSFLNVMEQINDVMDIQGKLTFKQSQALQEVFATRGQVSPRLILESFKGMREDIEKANKEIEGFTKKMAEIKMDTIKGQTARMSNIMKVLFEDFITATQGTGDFVEALKQLADTLESIRTSARGAGDILGWVGYNLGQLGLQYDALFKAIKQQTTAEAWDILGVNWWKDYVELQELWGRKLKTPTQYIEDLIKAEQKLREIRKKQETERTKGQQKLETDQDTVLGNAKVKQEEIKNEITILKILGATEKEIARYRIESLEVERLTMTDAEYRVQQQVRLNAYIQAELKSRQSIKKVMQDMYVDYMQAELVDDKGAQTDIRSLMNALTFKPETMVIWWRTATDKWRQMILENFALLSAEQQDALREYWEATQQLQNIEVFSPVAKLREQFKELPTSFWESFIEKMDSLGVVDKIRERLLSVLEGATISAREGEPLSPEQQRKESDRLVGIVNKQMAERDRLVKAGHLPKGALGQEKFMKPQVTIERIEVTAEGVTPEEIAEAVKEEVKERLESDETIRKIRPKL